MAQRYKHKVKKQLLAVKNNHFFFTSIIPVKKNIDDFEKSIAAIC